ncbi:Low temperature viability protein-domain-containing protein [Gilbertella persicaria]|uniref:Low temperature viability protein-domain-containing protein n=1 Tax=Gilbertella persicaria TaxID=101096 RepID=UPI00221E4AB7|nr:Low temperature viability protein-domain-containing protein [Gilbertella persicaria]KAI8058918.1 Low temperature viability protein-domain-containing protein [Gilbertella persicaria]
MGKKPFIDKKSAKHFHVVHRSQKDPLINDTEASDRVLQEVLPINQLKHKPQAEIDRVKAKPKKLTQDEIDQRIGQAAQHGIFFDDGEYDYMQHLRTIGDATDAVFLAAPSTKKEKPKTMDDGFLKDEYREKKNPRLIELPSSVLPSQVEMSVGVMNQSTGLDQGLQPDMDPRLREVFEALSDEEYIEDLDDDFFDALNADGEPYDPEEDEDYVDSDYEDYEQEEEQEVVTEENYDWEAAFKKFKMNQSKRDSDDDDELDDFDRQTRQTGFSMSSSAMHRNPQLRLLDDRFEKIEEEYAEESEEDDEEEEETEERADFEAILDDFLEKYEIVGRKMQPKMEGETSAAKLDMIRQGLLKTHIHEQVEVPRSKPVVLEPKLERPVQKQRETWDVQSVISTYSNLENHPSLISDQGPSKRIRIDPKTGMPILVEVARKQKKKEQEEVENESESEEEEEEEMAENKGVPRSKQETKEEKKARKQAVKDAKKVIKIIHHHIDLLFL